VLLMFSNFPNIQTKIYLNSPNIKTNPMIKTTEPTRVK